MKERLLISVETFDKIIEQTATTMKASKVDWFNNEKWEGYEEDLICEILARGLNCLGIYVED